MNWHKIEATWRPAPFWSWNDAMDSKELEILEDNVLPIHKVELNLVGQPVSGPNCQSLASALLSYPRWHPWGLRLPFQFSRRRKNPFYDCAGNKPVL